LQTNFAMLAEQRIDSVSTRDKDKKIFVKNLTIEKLKFTLDAYKTSETSNEKQVLDVYEVAKEFQTETPQKLVALHICEAMNDIITKTDASYSDVKKKPVTALNLPLSTMKFLHSQKQLSTKHKAGQLYDFYKSRLNAIAPYLLIDRKAKRSESNSIDLLIRQIDIDFKNEKNGKEKAQAVYHAIKTDFPFCGISVGGCGVFVFLVVSERCKDAKPEQLVQYYKKLFSEKYDCDFEINFDSIANTQIRGFGYTQDVTINETFEIHDFDFNTIVNLSSDSDSDFTFVDSPLMAFLSNHDYLESYLISKGFSKCRKGRFVASCQTSSTGNPIYESEHGTLFLKPFSSSLQNELNSSKPLHLRQLIKIYEGFDTNEQANKYILDTFGVDVTYKKIKAEQPQKNLFLGYETERFELSKTQYISDGYNDDLNDKILLFLGATGIGKTTLIQSYKHSIVGSFLSTTVGNYENEGFNIYKGKSEKHDLFLNGNDKNAATFASLTAVYTAKKTQWNNDLEFYKNTVLVIDEFQQLLTDSFAKGTLYKTIAMIKHHVKNGGKVRLLTANELIFDFDFLEGLKIKHFVKDAILKPLKIYSFDSSKKIETFANFVNISHQNKREVLSLTNRTELHDHNKELQKFTGNKAQNLDKNSKNTFDFSQGLNTSIFATTALNTGVNIYAKNTDCAILEYNDFTQLSQFFGRLRYRINETFLTQNNTYSLFNNFYFEDNGLNYNDCLELSKRHLKNLIKTAKSEVQFCINSEVTKNKKLHGSNVIWNNKLNICEVDYLTINQENHSYLNNLLHTNKDAFVTMMERQGYEVEFLEYNCEVESEVLTDDKNEFKPFLTCLKLTALSNIQKECFVNVNGSDYAIEYKNKSFDYWFKKASFKDTIIKKLYYSYKELTTILTSDKMSFEVLTDSVNYSDVIFDKFIKTSSRSTNESFKIIDSKRIVQRFAFAAAYYKIDSVKFQNFVDSLTATNLTTNDILEVLQAANNEYEFKFFKNTKEKDKAGLKAALGIVSDLKKWFGNDLTSIVRKTLLSIDKNDSKDLSNILIRVLSNHFKTDTITTGSGAKRKKSYQFEILGKKSDFK
jgi:hypothetical protein